MSWDRLGELLVAQNLLSAVKWSSVITEHQRWGASPVRLLLDKGLVDEPVLLRVLSHVYKLPAVTVDEGTIPAAVIDLVPAADAEKYELLPFRRDGNFLDVALGDPGHLDGVEHVRARTHLNVRPYVTGLYMLHRAIARYYGRVIVGAAAVDPRVTSGMFLRGDTIDLESASRKMGAVKAGPEQPVALAPAPSAVDQRLQDLEQRLIDQSAQLKLLEALLRRDEDVIRRLLGLLIDKGVTTRDELTELLK
jgi:hypothetical protein